MRSRTAVIEPSAEHNRVCPSVRARTCEVRLDGKSWSITIESATVADVVRVFVESGLLVGATSAGLRVGERFLPPYVELTPPWYHDGEVLDVVRWDEGLDDVVRSDTHDDTDQSKSVTIERSTASPVARLVVTSGPGAGDVLDLVPGRCVIGRDAGCDVRLASVAVSARHAELRVSPGGELAIVDLGTTNGTYFADGIPVTSSLSSVRIGDVLTIGPCRLALVGSFTGHERARAPG